MGNIFQALMPSPPLSPIYSTLNIYLSSSFLPSLRPSYHPLSPRLVQNLLDCLPTFTLASLPSPVIYWAHNSQRDILNFKSDYLTPLLKSSQRHLPALRVKSIPLGLAHVVLYPPAPPVPPHCFLMCRVPAMHWLFPRSFNVPTTCRFLCLEQVSFCFF